MKCPDSLTGTGPHYFDESIPARCVWCGKTWEQIDNPYGIKVSPKVMKEIEERLGI